MSSSFEQTKTEYVNIFKTNPVWNYDYYLIIEAFTGINNKKAAMGFKSVKINNSEINEFYDVDSNIAFDSIIDDPQNIQLSCEYGITHDPEFNQYIEDNKEKKLISCNMILLHVNQNDETYEKRIKNNYKAIKNIKSAWILKSVALTDYILGGVDYMYNEVLINSMSFKAQSVNLLKMTEELSERKACEAVSRIL